MLRLGEHKRVESQHLGEESTQEAAVIHSMWYSGPLLALLESPWDVPSVLSIGTVTAGSIKSSDRVFLIADDANTHYPEWRLCVWCSKT